MAKLEEKIIHKALYEKSVEWCDEIKYDMTIPTEEVIELAHNILFELQLCYRGDNSSYYTCKKTGKVWG